jgi:choline dehydrogenase-like flavoprotein
LSFEADVCVIGAGAGGSVASWALTERGLRVLLLEAGSRIDPKDQGTHRQDWEITPSPVSEAADDPRHQCYESAAGAGLDLRYRNLRSRTPTAFSRRTFERRPFRYVRAVGVGGSTLHYQGEAHRFPAHAFRMRSRFGVAEDWPIDHTELAPYYERIEALLGVAGDPRNPFKPARGPYPYPAHPFSAASRRVAQAARQLGWELLPNPVAILPRSRPGREACHYCNGCVHGCEVSARGSADVAVIPEAERSGRLKIVTGIRTTALEYGDDGRITAAIGSDASGREQRFTARAFVVATGAIETPRILLHSAGGAHPEGVGNADGQLGRHLMETLYVRKSAIFDEPLETFAGIPLDSRIWDFNGAAGDSTLPVGFTLATSCGPFGGPVGHALEGVRNFGAAHRKEMRAFGGGISFDGVAEQLPRPENRVTLSDKLDSSGVPLARVETELDETDLEALSRVEARLAELAGAAGIQDFAGQVTAYDTPHATHVGGGCRMGSDPRNSVVDAFGGVHGVPNLTIADASVLVTQGSGDSPSLTIQALALRSSEFLVERMRRGEI